MPPTPTAPTEAADRPVRCSCTSAATCPAIGRLAIGSYKPQTLYCNQLHGSENPGIRTDDAWTYQCVELANRWLTESVGAPMIRGNADQLCRNADRRHYDVHTSGGPYEPVPGDLLVWSGGRMGHVGIAREISPSAVVLANQNYGHDGLQYPLLRIPRTNGFFGNPLANTLLRPQCIIHPRKLSPRPRRATPVVGDL